MAQTKIQLLPAELELVSTPDFILTKNAILQKIRSFFEELQVKQSGVLNNYSFHFPAEIQKVSPKISRGENYKGLPWLVLDNPRVFQHNNIFAIRTMFWWGNFFSVTLHLSGNNKLRFRDTILKNISLLKENGLYIYIGNDEWEHDLAPASYQRISELTAKELNQIVSANSFLKLATKIPIDLPVNIEDKLLRSFELLVKCCC